MTGDSGEANKSGCLLACLQVGKEGRKEGLEDLEESKQVETRAFDDIMSKHLMVKNAPGTLVLPWQIFHSGVMRKGSTEALCEGLIR